MLYFYTAVDGRGTMKEGEYDAPNKEAVLNYLSRQGLTPISVKEKKAGAQVRTQSNCPKTFLSKQL